MEFMNFDNFAKLYESDNWDFVLDISNIWNEFSNGKMDIKTFCIRYKEYIESRKNDIISKFSEESWNKLQQHIIKLANVIDRKSANTIFDDIYDWADGHEVLVKTNTENEIF